MDSISFGNFSQLIAYIIPGFIGIYELSNYCPNLRRLFYEISQSGWNFVYIIFLSLLLSLLISPIRWLIIDKFLMTNIFDLNTEDVKFSKLKGHLEEYQAIVENYYSYYKFYSNTLLIGTIASASILIRWINILNWYEVIVIVVIIIALDILFAQCARNSLDKYIKRAKDLLNS